jgi:hypothetical protein
LLDRRKENAEIHFKALDRERYREAEEHGGEVSGSADCRRTGSRSFGYPRQGPPVENLIETTAVTTEFGLAASRRNAASDVA